ncbi:DNA-binding protein REB1-like [Gastrolobium bilobum]|uniref:DNA-binding protein REB1-like n=1 Tax=Gastrolobium bilobum TaxID=150636 RepID=UPI002AB2E63E|nr:DNA-binding protein REB1-like [Gastrolobium bilobum]XP_061369794.1 DNA-binding protein REB1-like [Gastrolobium bilobum]
MGEKAKKERSDIDRSNLGSSFELKPNEGKKNKHKDRKKMHVTDKILNSNETLEENCTAEAADKQTCSTEGNITFMLDREEESHINKRKKIKGRKDIKVMNSDLADDKEMQYFDDNQQSKMKKRKSYDDSTGIAEMGFSKSSKKGKMSEDKEFKNNKGDLPLDKINKGNANAHSLVTEDDLLGKKMEKKKKKLGNKSKMTVRGYKSNEADYSVVSEEGHGKKKKMEKISGKKNKRTEDEEYKINSDPPFVNSKKGDQHLVKSHEGEDDDQDKKLKEKKKKKILSEESKHVEYNEFTSNEGKDDDQGKKMKKKLNDKSKSKGNSEFKTNEGDANASCIVTEVDDQCKKKIKKKTKAGTGESPNPVPGGTSKPKRVTFSDQVEFCCDDLVRGKRFTPEEDKKIKEAVFDYIESHGLGDEGLDMILHSRSHPELRGCWKDIGSVLPERPYISVYYRAHILFERDEKRKWTPEELEFVRKVQEQHGSDWKSVAEALGKHRFHVKDAWRRIKLTNTNKGRWSQEEYQNLFDLVNLDLRARALEDHRKSKHGMLRDNISWEAIGNKLTTRTSPRCCKKWYEQLTSSMVAKGEWSDTDDYRLVNALFTLDACCMEEVDWDYLLDHRSGDVCRKRWSQMVQYIGEHGRKSFAEQVEILAKRFCPDLLEAREAFDSKPVVC